MSIKPTVRILNSRFPGGGLVRQLCFKEPKGKLFTRSQIKKKALEFKSKLQKDNLMQVMLHSPDGPKEYQPGDFFSKDSKEGEYTLLWHANMYDDIGATINVDDEKYDRFYLTFRKAPPKIAGYDKHNDCLYNAISLLVPKEKLLWRTPEDFKKFLGVKREDKVDIPRFIQQVENYLPDYKINVYGDYKYHSLKKAFHTIDLDFRNGHVKVHEKQYRALNFQHGIADEEKIPLVKKHKLIDGKYKVYDGNKSFYMYPEELHHIRSRPND